MSFKGFNLTLPTSISLKKEDVDPRLVYTAGAVMLMPLTVKFLRACFKRDVHSSFSSYANSVSMLNNEDSVLEKDGVNASIDGYEKLFGGARKENGTITTDESIKTREKEYQTMVNSFYNLVTDFYEYGWGQSFHFAPRYVGETFMESIKRCEYFLVAAAGFGKGDKVLDVGCGVGGPLRNIAQHSKASITGVTINEYQVKVGNKYNAQKGLADTCKLVQGDFQKLKEIFEPESFDAAYAIEATCHSPDRVKTFSGVAHCLKKGGIFVGYEWVVLPEKGYDKNNKDHVRVKEGIEVGNGLPTLATAAEVIKSLEDSGFEVIESYDANANVHSEFEVPWYQTLKGSYDLSGFRMTHFGRICTHIMVTTLELLRIAPKGTVKVSALLNATALDLVEGGEQEIFTPSYFFKAVKK